MTIFGPSASERIIAFVVRWLVLAVAVWVAAEIVTGIHLEGWKSTLIVALILGALNTYLKPILQLIILPLTIVTFGLFLIVINTLMLLIVDWLAGEFDLRFAIDSFGSALLGAIIISIVGFLLGTVFNAERIARDFGRRF